MDGNLNEIAGYFGVKTAKNYAPRPSQYDAIFDRIGDEEGVDPDFLRAMTHQESTFNPKAVSPKNAQGLMQLIPATAQRFGVTNTFDPEQNIRGGAKYARWLLDEFGGDVDLALAGYNAGEGAVKKYGNKIPPYAETQDYVKRIRGNYQGSGYHPKLVKASDDLQEIAGYFQTDGANSESPIPQNNLAQPDPNLSEIAGYFEQPETVSQNPVEPQSYGLPQIPASPTDEAGNLASEKLRLETILRESQNPARKAAAQRRLNQITPRLNNTPQPVQSVGNYPQELADVEAVRNQTAQAGETNFGAELPPNPFNRLYRQKPSFQTAINDGLVSTYGSSYNDTARIYKQVTGQDLWQPETPLDVLERELDRRYNANTRRFENVNFKNDTRIHDLVEAFESGGEQGLRAKISEQPQTFSVNSPEPVPPYYHTGRAQQSLATRQPSQRPAQQVGVRTTQSVNQINQTQQPAQSPAFQKQIKLGNGESLYLDGNQEGLEQGSARYSDADGETYVIGQDGKVRDESLNAVIEKFPINLVPKIRRFQTSPDLAKTELSQQVADKLAKKYNLPASDVVEYYKQFGFTDLATGQLLPEERLYVTDLRNTDELMIKHRDLKNIEAYSVRRRELLENQALEILASGRDLSDKEKQYFLQNDLDLNSLADKRYEDFELAKAKAEVAKRDFNRYLQDFQNQGLPQYVADLKAKAQLGWIDKDRAEREIQSYTELRRQTVNDETPSPMMSGRRMSEFGNVPAIPGAAELGNQRANSFMNDVLEANGSILERNKRIREAELKETARKAAVQNMPLGEYLLKSARDIPLNVVKSAVSTAISGSMRGATLFTKPLANFIDWNWQLENKSSDVKNNPMYKAADSLDKFLNTYLPTDENLKGEFLQGELPQALGSSLGMVVGGWAKNPKTAIALFSTLQTGGSAYQQAIESGATEAQAQKVGLIEGGLLGWTETLGMGKTIERLNTGKGAGVWRKLFSEMYREGKKEISEEILQEGVQNTTSNIVDSLVYNPERKIDQGLYKSLLAAGFSAGLASSGVTIINTLREGRRVRKTIENDTAPVVPNVEAPQAESVSPVEIQNENLASDNFLSEANEAESQISKPQPVKTSPVVGDSVLIDGTKPGVVKKDNGKTFIVDFDNGSNGISTQAIRKNRVQAVQPAAEVSLVPVAESIDPELAEIAQYFEPENVDTSEPQIETVASEPVIEETQQISEPLAVSPEIAEIAAYFEEPELAASVPETPSLKVGDDVVLKDGSPAKVNKIIGDKVEVISDGAYSVVGANTLRKQGVEAEAAQQSITPSQPQPAAVKPEIVGKPAKRESLVVPFEAEINSSEKKLIEENLDYLHHQGFEVSPISDSKIAIKTAPETINRYDTVKEFKKLVKGISGANTNADTDISNDEDVELGENEPHYTRPYDQNQQPLFDRSEAPIVERLENLAASHESNESILKTAKVERRGDIVLLNESATEIVRRMLGEMSGTTAPVLLGAYLRPNVADNLLTQLNINRRYNLKDFDSKTKLREIENTLEDALDGNYKDLVIVTNSDLAPDGLRLSIQEEAAHRADFRTRNFVPQELSAFKDVDGYVEAYQETMRTYPDASPSIVHAEIIAKTFRDDATEILGISQEQADAIQAKYYELQYNKDVEYTSIEKEFSKVASTKATRFLDNAKREFERRFIADGRQGANEIRATSDDQRDLWTESDPSRTTTAQEVPGNRFDGFQSDGISQSTRSASESDVDLAEIASYFEPTNTETLFARPTSEELKPENVKEKITKSLETIADWTYDGKRDVPVAEGVTNLVRTGLLAAVGTVTNNLVSNTAMQITEQASKPFMAAADMLNSLRTKRRHVAGFQPMGVVKGFVGKDGVVRNELRGDGFVGGLVKGISDKEANKFDLASETANPNFVRSFGVPALDAVIEGVKRLVVAGDRPFKAFAKEGEKRNLAKVQALNDKRLGLIKTNREFKARMKEYVENPTQLMIEQMERYADVVTFQNSNQVLDYIGEKKQNLLKGEALNKAFPHSPKAVTAVSSAAYIAANSTVPFLNVPTNVGIRSLEYFFPTGVVKAAWDFYQVGRSSERKRWGRRTEQQRKAYTKDLEKARADEDKRFERKSNLIERNLQNEYDRKVAEFDTRIATLKGFKNKAAISKLTEAEKQKDSFIADWNKRHDAAVSKRQAGFEAMQKEREESDINRTAYWAGEDAASDLNFSAYENRRFAETAGRAGFGGTVGGLVLLGVMYGLVEAVGSTDMEDEPEKAQAKREAGIPDDSINIAGYRTNYSKNPFGYALKMGVNLMEQYQRPGTGKQKALAMAKRFGKDLVSSNPLSQSASGEFMQSDAGSIIGNKLAAPIPRILGEIGEVLDDKPRKYFNQGFASQFAIKLPFLRTYLPETDSNKVMGSLAERGSMSRRALRMIDPLKLVHEYAPQDQLPITPLGTKQEQKQAVYDEYKERADKGEDINEILRQKIDAGEIKEREADRILEAVEQNYSSKTYEFKNSRRPAEAVKIFREASEQEKLEMLPILQEKADSAKSEATIKLYQKAITEYQQKQK